ncbi:MAG: UDP-glucose/GDP-mannose dehydrogenase family protein [Candidatus Omnitrophica bacterium]|nr:UDP-glucose/GDP-mannose dehydrogenase family protein [Candidatus Omnitrophota bacterium]MCB9747377.1 UDP-glucose/GDP-mannose dehydrogenase family protein [Candidatus Omnitrophota bacterium]
MNIAVVGSGYVGLVTGVCLAHIGHDVICVDIDEAKIKTLKQAKVPIYEPGLEDLLKKYLKNKRLRFTTSIKEATKESTAIFIAVGTPSKKNGEADLTYVENVAREIAVTMDSYKLIIEKSTVPADTGRRIERTIRLNLKNKIKQEKKGDREFDVASNPEFLREGSAVHDFMNPDRVVIGVESKKAEKILREIYKPLKPKMVVTNIKSAELIKHASNSFLATKISFINAIAQICDHIGGDVLKVAEGMGYDKRIGRAFLNAGVGYGGSCFPKDVDAFIRLSEKSGYNFRLLKEVRNVNEEQKSSFIRLIEDKLWIVKNKVIGVLGLAFKADTDDMRNAPSIDIIQALQAEGAKIRAYDPQAVNNAKKVLEDIIYCKDPYELAKDCDCLLILTEWDEFKDIDFTKIKKSMKQDIIFDGRNLYSDNRLGDIGFEYHGIGRGQV